VARQRDGEGFGLDRGTEIEPGILKPFQYAFIEAEAVKSDVGQVRIGHGRLGYSNFAAAGLENLTRMH
jgi:hypothetical protein